MIHMIMTHLGPVSLLGKAVVTHTMGHQGTRGNKHPRKFYWFPHSCRGRKNFGPSGAFFTGSSCSFSRGPFVGKPVLEGHIQRTSSGGPGGLYVHEGWNSADVLENIMVLFMFSDTAEWMAYRHLEVSHNCGKTANRWKPDQQKRYPERGQDIAIHVSSNTMCLPVSIFGKPSGCSEYWNTWDIPMHSRACKLGNIKPHTPVFKHIKAWLCLQAKRVLLVSGLSFSDLQEGRVIC